MTTSRWGRRARSALAGLCSSLVAIGACQDDEPHLNPRPEEDPSNSLGEPSGNSGGEGNVISDPSGSAGGGGGSYGGDDGPEPPAVPDAGLPAPDAGPPDGGAGDGGSGGADGLAAESDE